jgi:hypothetical protein
VDRAVQTSELSIVEPARVAAWVELGLEEDLVGVHVADTGDGALVHQSGFEGVLAPQGDAQGLSIEGRGPGIRAEVGRADVGFGIVDQTHAAEQARIDEGDVSSIVEIEAHAVVSRVVGGVVEVGEVPRHAEMKVKPALVIPGLARGLEWTELDEEVLAVASRGGELGVFGGARQRARREAVERPRVTDVDVLDASVKSASPQTPAKVLDVGQLGHGPLWSVCVVAVGRQHTRIDVAHRRVADEGEERGEDLDSRG